MSESQRLLETCYIIKLSDKTEIPLRKIEAEKIMLILASNQKPQFLFIDEEMINTSYITGVIFRSSGYNSERRELTREENEIHNKFMATFNIKYIEPPKYRYEEITNEKGDKIMRKIKE